MKSKMLSNVFTLMMLTAAMSSCEKMTLSESAQSENGEKGNVVLRVTQFEQTPFDAQTRADVGSVCTRLCFRIYNLKDSTQVGSLNQKLDDSNFGTASFSLNKGHYILVVVGHYASSNPSFTNKLRVSITGDNLGDTFWCCEEFDVGDDEIELSLRLKRIVSLLRFIPTDNKPKDMNQIRFTYKGNKGSFDIKTGYGIGTTANYTQYITLNDVDPDADQYEFYMIPNSDNDLLDITVSSHNVDGEGKVHNLTEKVISQVPVKRNCVTICRGSLFDGTSSSQSVFITISVDADWDENIDVTF